MVSATEETSQELRPYVYRVLDTQNHEIRLLRLLPNKEPNAPLEGTLETVSLNDSPHFHSLSYVWGQSTTANEPLRIDNAALRITSNLQHALGAVRQADSVVTLWCDRVCIDQNNRAERNHQVHLMRRIFSAAQQVNIWLGPGFSGAAGAFTSLRELAAGKPLLGILQQTYPSDPATGVKDLMGIFSYPWWQRLWVIQEALLAREAVVRCGSHVIDLESIMEAFELVWNQFVQDSGPLYQLCGADSVQTLVRQLQISVRRLHVVRSLVIDRQDGKERKLQDGLSKWPFVMHMCAWSHATDDRDKVYGTLGLFPSLLLDVDYSLSLRQTYSRSTFAVMERLHDLSVLTQTVSQVSIENGLPSWVPDWRHPEKTTASPVVFYNYFGAGRDIAPHAQLLEEEVLQLNGQYVDKVDEVGALYDDGDCESISKLLPLLKTVIEDWLRVGRVPDVKDGSFLSTFTSKIHNVFSYISSANKEARSDVGTSGSSPKDRGTKRKADAMYSYQTQQSQHAPLYVDAAYSLPRPAAQTKDVYSYLQPQSQNAPLYTDAAYSLPRPAAQTNDTPANSGPRIYDAFSHTYRNPTGFHHTTPTAKSRQASDKGEEYIGGAASSEAFWRTLCMDIVEGPDLKKHRRCKRNDSWRVWEWVDWVFGRAPPASGIPQLHWHLNTHLQGKRIIRTKRGYLGLAGKEVQKGDQIRILGSGAYPYVLRQATHTDDHHQLRMVSAAYVHGTMDGNVLETQTTSIRIS